MTDGEWMEVAREFTHKYWDAGVDVGGIVARAMAMVAEETRELVREDYHEVDPTDAEIISRLRARLKSEKGTG